MTEFIESSSMVATAATLNLASIVLGFELVELWCRDASDSKLRCIYVHATKDVKEKHPEIIVGHFPSHQREHKHSPVLCADAFASSEKYIWTVLPENSFFKSFQDQLAGKVSSYSEVAFPIKTEMAFQLEADTGSTEVFIVCMSSTDIPFSPSKLKFLSGLGYAIFIAAFDLDKAHDSSLPEGFEVNSARDALEVRAEVQHHHQRLRAASATPSDKSLQKAAALGLNLPPFPSMTLAQKKEGDDDTKSRMSEGSQSLRNQQFKNAYVYPILSLPIKNTQMRDNLTLDDFQDVKHIADGSNANIFLGLLGKERVVIKMIKVEAEYDSVAIEEFELERAMLIRLDHPTIIKIYGSGSNPRRFIVLEYLAGGSLNTLLNENLAKPGLAQKLFRKPSFTYINLLQAAKEMAEALDYLHNKCHAGATILHRDLKPDNIGFDANKTIKLFDFGLVTCVKTRSTPDQAYDMTGYTGSLRYMAPEVAMRQPYTEKVDVYSYAIVVWQMARDRIPFKGLLKDEFFQIVVTQGERPKLDKTWPVGFSDLVTQCWHKEPQKRPTFEVVIQELEKLIRQAGGTASLAKKK